MHWPLECIGLRLPRNETIHLRQRSRLDSRLSCLPNRSVSKAIKQREILVLEELEGRPSLQQSLAMSREIPGWLRLDDWQASKLATVALRGPDWLTLFDTDLGCRLMQRLKSQSSFLKHFPLPAVKIKIDTLHLKNPTLASTK